MLTIEQYQNLSNHIKYAHMKLDSIMTKKCLANDVEVTDLIIGVEEHLREMQDTLDFLVVTIITNNK